jgi:hypothetical protein
MKILPFCLVELAAPGFVEPLTQAKLRLLLMGKHRDQNPAFSDVLYVEELIGPHTINTIPPATLNAFRDHGRVQPTLEAGEQDGERALARLAKLGIDLGAITEKLLADGITAFTHNGRWSRAPRRLNSSKRVPRKISRKRR